MTSSRLTAVKTQRTLCLTRAMFLFWQMHSSQIQMTFSVTV